MKSNINALRNILRQLNYILSRNQKKSCILVFFCMMIGSGLELLGVSAIYPFLQMMLDSEELKKTWYVRWIYRVRPDIEDITVLLVMGAAIILVYIFKNLFMLALAYIENAFAARFERKLSTVMLKAFMKRPYEFFLNTNSGNITRSITVDVGGVYQVILNIFTIMSEMLTIALLGAYLLVSDFMMAVSALVLALVCLCVVTFGLKRKMKRAGSVARMAIAQSKQNANHAIMGIKEIKVSDRAGHFVKKYEDAAKLNEKATLTNAFISACPDRILEGVGIGGLMGIVCVKILIGTDLRTFIPVLGAFAMAAFKILPSTSKISARINSIVFYQQHLQATYDNLKAANEYEADLDSYIRSSMNTLGEQGEKIKFSQCIEVNGIKWKYLNTKENVLDNLSIRINKGESVAFIGPSGAGKTTLADILMGLLKPQEGSVKMDGIDIFAIPHQWAKIIGYVPQSVFLIDDTIRNNVAFGVDANDISDEKIWWALERAQLKDFVERLPAGLDMIVGERGIKFSGGQRQRVAIARALYENPDILVLDEATASLDNDTETAVMEAIDALQGQKTLIIVAHRLSTIRNCDKIYEIKDGVAELCNKEEIIGL